MEHPIATTGFANVLACSIKTVPSGELFTPRVPSYKTCKERGHHEIPLPLEIKDGYYRCVTCGVGIFK